MKNLNVNKESLKSKLEKKEITQEQYDKLIALQEKFNNKKVVNK